MNNEAAAHWHEWTKSRAVIELTEEISDLMDLWADGVQGRYGNGAFSYYEYSYCSRCGKVLL